jgi:hypothetical protein
MAPGSYSAAHHRPGTSHQYNHPLPSVVRIAVRKHAAAEACSARLAQVYNAGQQFASHLEAVAIYESATLQRDSRLTLSVEYADYLRAPAL